MFVLDRKSVYFVRKIAQRISLSVDHDLQQDDYDQREQEEGGDDSEIEEKRTRKLRRRKRVGRRGECN